MLKRYFSPLRVVPAFILFILSLALLTWTSWYFPPQTETFQLNSLENALLPSPEGSAPAYWITVKWSTTIRAGDKGMVEVSLDPRSPNGQGNPAADLKTKPDCAVDTVNVFCSFNPMVEATLSIPGMQVDPAGEIQKPMTWGQPLDFKWNVTSGTVGTYAGTAWLHLDLVPQSPGGKPSRQPILARHIEVRNTGLLGVNTLIWRLAGEFGILGAVLILFRRIKKRAVKK